MTLVCLGVLIACDSGSSGSSNFCADQAKLHKQYRSVLDRLNPPSHDEWRTLAAQLRSLSDEAGEPAKSDLVTLADVAEKTSASGSPGFVGNPTATKAAVQLDKYVNAHCA